MVQINLPANSKVEKGTYYKDKTGSKNIRRVNVYRWDPSKSENPITVSAPFRPGFRPISEVIRPDG